jgi:hypothetical protein
VLVETFLENGWQMDLNTSGTIGDLQVHRYRKRRRNRAETDGSCRRNAPEPGFAPVLSVKDSNSVRISRLRSLAAEPALLAGKGR